MLGDLVTRVLVLFLGYGYPAFETFKMLEESAVEMRKLRFWSQYWTIVGIVTIFEWFADLFVSWLPMYGEGKIALFIYLWHPKTQGTIMVYEAFLRPLVVRHEPDIEQKLRCFRAKSAELILFYIRNFTEKGQSFFLDLLRYVISRPPSIIEESKRRGSSRTPHPITLKRSGHSGPAAESEAYTEPDVMEFDPEEFLRCSGEEAAGGGGGGGRARSRTRNKK